MDVFPRVFPCQRRFRIFKNAIFFFLMFVFPSESVGYPAWCWFSKCSCLPQVLVHQEWRFFRGMVLELMSVWDSGNGVQNVFVQLLILKHGVCSSNLCVL